MKTSGYSKNPRKNHWRRWQWNRIVERLAMIGIKPRDAVVLYLAAEEDADRAEALRRGFSFHNLIAVDHSEDVVAKLRAEGKTAICCELGEAVAAWPEANVIVADYCCGVELRDIKSSGGIFSISKRVVAFNFQRGRDASCGSVVASLIGTKHRGRVFSRIYAGAVRERCREWGIQADLRVVEESMIPAFNQYKSDGNVYFDSVVFTALPLNSKATVDASCVRKIAAAKAIRTQRINGTLRRAA